MDSNPRTSPQPLTPRDLLLAEINGTLDLWQHGRDHPIIGPVAARDLLAHWGGLRRVQGDPVSDDRAVLLDRLVCSAAAELGERMLPLGTGFAAAWRQRAEELSRTWDAVRLEDHDDVAWTAQLLFEDLDRLQLATWALHELLPPDNPLQVSLGGLDKETAQAEFFLADRPDLFVDRADELSEVLSSSRQNLDVEHPALWATLLKHRRVEEEQESAKALPTQAQLLAAAARFQRVPVRVAVEGVPERRHADGIEYAQAAGAGSSASLLHQLATASPPASMGEYRRAWAHFLACCFDRTPAAADWLDLFLKAAAAAGTLSEDWLERVDRARGLLQQRDWKRRHGGHGILSLETRPLHTQDDLLRWLLELVGPSGFGS